MFKFYKHISIVVFLVIPFFGIAQNQAANWYFGQRAGLNFNSGFPIVELNGVIDTPEGCSTISDRRGQLLFYSDGITVWNKNHVVMQNGDDLFGDKSATQSALIVPKPSDDSIYYIFTVDDRAGSSGLRYSEVDITLDGGLGAVTSNKNIPLANPTTEKITAIESSDGRSIWVISHLWNSDAFVSFLVTTAGVNTTPVISNVGSNHQGDINNTIGYLKASPNREKIACVKSYDNNETQVFDFDATTGILSNPITISNYSAIDIGPYGCEFSPDSNLLYITEIDRATISSTIHQYDLTQPTQQAIINSDIIVGQSNEELGALQQALDGRIYVAKQGSTSLGVITNPNDIGVASNFLEDGIHLGGNSSHFGLPPFIQSYFFATNVFRNTCFGDTTEFGINTSTVIDGIQWDFGDPTSGANNTSNVLNPTHVYTNIGEYTVTISIDTEGDIQIVYRTLIISDRPPVMSLDPMISCEIGNGIAEFNLQDAIPTVISDDPNIVASYYETQDDAENFTNSIINVNAYPNESNPQTIFVRLQNSIRGDCFSISVLDLIVSENPIIEETDSEFFCENSEDDVVILNVGPLLQPENDFSFLWLESLETTSQIEVSNQGIYTVRVTLLSSITAENLDGCFVDRVITVSSSSVATIDNIEIINGNSITVTASGIGDYEYAIDNIDGPYQDSNTFHNIEAGVHTIYVRDKNDCGIVQDFFSIVGYPLFFTPNDDGYNDTWFVKGLSDLFQPNSKIYIFDRYGKLLKQINPTSDGWDGTFNGKELPVGDYWFSAKLQDGRTFKSHFTLKR